MFAGLSLGVGRGEAVKSQRGEDCAQPVLSASWVLTWLHLCWVIIAPPLYLSLQWNLLPLGLGVTGPRIFPVFRTLCSKSFL